MTRKPSSYYQNRYRERLRQKGFVKREVWIPSEQTAALKLCEEALRDGRTPEFNQSRKAPPMTQNPMWTTDSLMRALQESEPARNGEMDVTLIDGTEPGIVLTMNEFGDLPLYMSVAGSQIIVDTLLWPVDEIRDRNALNDQLLRMHKFMPLSTFGITQGPDGRDYYEIFGALSAGSKLESILFEIEMLADNALQSVEAYAAEQDAA